MAVFSTNDSRILMPRNLADGMIQDTQTTSTVAKLSAQEPQKFGETDYIVFNDMPKAEFVEEGAEKSHTTGGFSTVTAKPRKAQVTMRFNEEVQWADEDYQLGILNTLAGAGGTALSRALDLGIYHRVNPLTGSTISSWDNYITATDKKVQYDGTAEADAAIREAVGLLVQDSKTVTGVAIDPKLSWDLAGLQTKLANGDPSGVQRYPNLGFGTDIGSFLGLNAAQGNTVSGLPEAEDTGVRAIVGDFTSGIRWGIQRNLPVEVIRYGDPDGQGDLTRHNQIALRLEIVYGWYAFADRFATVNTTTTSEG